MNYPKKWRLFSLGINLGIHLSIYVSLTIALHASEWRLWKSNSGSQLDAKLISHTSNEVVLEKRDGTQLTIQLKQLSPDDQTYLTKITIPSEATTNTPPNGKKITGINATPGSVSERIPCQAETRWSYMLYLPLAFDSSKTWPVCFVMSPNGGNANVLKRYIKAAEHLGLILAVSIESRNEFVDAELAMMAMVKDVYDRVPVMKNFTIASGMSGGSRMAFLMAETEKTIAGVLACGSGDGVYPREGDFRQANLRTSTIVCSLIGSNDFNRREAVESHKGFNKDSRFIWFIGNHVWADEELILDGMSHLYGKILNSSKDSSLDSLRANFSKKHLQWAKNQQEKSPEVAHHWAQFLSKFPGDLTARKEAEAWFVELNNTANVTQILKAEAVIKDFADEYFSDGDTTADKTPDSLRAKEAEKKAAPFGDIPQAQLLKKLGNPVKGG